MSNPVTARLGRLGIWSRELRFNPDRGAATAAAAELEELGFSALFIPDVGGDVLGAAAELLRATSTVTLATGILNIWAHEPADVATGTQGLETEFPDRFVLGLGNGHAANVDTDAPGRYQRPYSKMVNYLDELGQAGLGGESLMLAALGPKMLTLSAERTGGAHPYLITSDYLVMAREALGPDACLAPELSVVLDSNPETARALARRTLAGYLELPNYTQNFTRMGFTDADFADGGSDRIVDALIAWGDETTIGARLREYYDAGADHVCLQVLGMRDEGLALDAWRRLAELPR